MTGVVIAVMTVASATLLTLSARFDSLVSTLLCGYLALVAAAVGTVLALSPFREVTSDGLLAGEAFLLAGSVALWLLRGRPRPPLRGARAALAAVVGRPDTAVFLSAFAVLLGYELLVGIGTPPNNWDALTYHLARAAAWVQHHGYYWIPNAPTERMNEFQPLAEQENLFLFAATGSVRLTAVPQFLAALAVFVAVYGSSRRLGYEARAAACATFLVATFGLVALEASTAQNDLVAASFPAVAACMLLGTGRLEAALGGAAVALGLAAKLTTALVLPILLVLALARGRRATLFAVLGGLAAFVSIAMWGFVLNEVHTGHLLGYGGGRVEDSQSPSWPASALTALDVLYVTMDLSTVPQRLYDIAAVLGVAALVASVVFALRREFGRSAGSAVAAIPLLAPFLAEQSGAVLAFGAREWGHPIDGPGGVIGGLTRNANEDTSAFGPIAAVLLLAVPFVAIGAWLRGRADIRKLALAASFPTFLVLLCLQAKWNAFLPRFLVVPVILAAPLLAILFRSRLAVVAFLVSATVVAGYTVTDVRARPLNTPFGHPWTLNSIDALAQAQDASVAGAVAKLDSAVPRGACLGAVLGEDEPAYLLYGPGLEHRVEYLPSTNTVLDALARGLFYVVISTGPNRAAAGAFRAADWRVRSLAGYWLLASEPHATTGIC